MIRKLRDLAIDLASIPAILVLFVVAMVFGFVCWIREVIGNDSKS